MPVYQIIGTMTHVSISFKIENIPFPVASIIMTLFICKSIWIIVKASLIIVLVFSIEDQRKKQDSETTLVLI